MTEMHFILSDRSYITLEDSPDHSYPGISGGPQVIGIQGGAPKSLTLIPGYTWRHGACIPWEPCVIRIDNRLRGEVLGGTIRQAPSLAPPEVRDTCEQYGMIQTLSLEIHLDHPDQTASTSAHNPPTITHQIKSLMGGHISG